MDKANLNTILLTVMLGVMGWVGYTTQETARQVAALSEKVSYGDREIIDLRARVTRLELDVADIRARAARP